MDVLSRVETAVRGISVIPAFPTGCGARVGAEPPESHADRRDQRSGLAYFLRYDGGSISERRVTVRSLRIEDNEVRHVLAHCHERQAVRLFRVDRVAEAVDIETGEILSAAQLCHALLNRGIPIAEQRLAAMIRILVFMARCDGHAHHLEWDEIDRSVLRLSRCLMDDDRAIEHMLTDARRLAPDGDDFMRALRGLTKTRLPSRMHQELRRAIGAVIEADGWHHDEEIRWGVEAMDLIAAMPTSG